MSKQRIEIKQGQATVEFTAKQWAFINAMVGEAAGNGSEAARIAGYAAPRQEASRLLTNAAIREAVSELFEHSPLIASRNERLAALSEIVRDKQEQTFARIKAMEVMASMQGDLKLKVDLKQQINVKDERDELKAMIDDIASKQEPTEERMH